MSDKSEFAPRHLFGALNFRLSDTFWKLDFIVGLFACGGTVWLVNHKPELVADLLPLANGVVGVVVGAVLAAAGLLTAFLDQAFLKKLNAINKSPVRYFAPFLWTALSGTATLLLMLLVAALEPSGWLFGTAASLAGLGVGWTLGSLVFDLDVLVQFLDLQQVASDVDLPEQGDGKRFGNG